jgi:hypothetical protein
MKRSRPATSLLHGTTERQRREVLNLSFSSLDKNKIIRKKLNLKAKKKN